PPHSNLVVNMSVHSAWITEEGGLPTITRRETPDHGRADRRAIRGRAPPESAPALHLITERTFEPPRGEPDGTHDHPPQRRPSRRRVLHRRHNRRTHPVPDSGCYRRRPVGSLRRPRASPDPLGRIHRQLRPRHRRPPRPDAFGRNAPTLAARDRTATRGHST